MELIGCFYFKKTSNGNLLGEYTNNHLQSISTESTSLQKGIISDFEGKYDTMWNDGVDANGVAALRNGVLTITPKGLKYKLEWKEGSEKSYEGEGMIVDNILIGYYHR